MKTYDEYHELCKEQCKKLLVKTENLYGKNWWKTDTEFKRHNLETTQDYDFIKPMFDKNDMPLVKNLTNLENSEWIILHNMISQMVIDYIKENGINDNIFSYSININFDDPKKKWTICLKSLVNESIRLPESEPYDFPYLNFISDSKVISKFNALNKKIYQYVCRFIDDNKKDIPDITNNINFTMDDITSSLKSNEWQPSSDSSLSVGWDRDGDADIDELLVVSL